MDTAGDGKAIIAVGNPDIARHTAVWVPGLGTTLDSTRGNVEGVLHLQQAAATLAGSLPGDVPTVLWLAYDAQKYVDDIITAGSPGAHAQHAATTALLPTALHGCAYGDGDKKAPNMQTASEADINPQSSTAECRY